MRKLGLGVVAATLAVGMTVPAQAATAPASASAAWRAAAAPKVKANAIQLVRDGKIIRSVRSRTRYPIASITKVMSVVVILRSKPNLDRVVTIKKKHTTHGDPYGATEAYLVAGDRVKVRDLLYAVMLESGADAMAALADTYGPGYKGFVTKMNGTAKTLGLKATKYANFDGLPYPTQTSTYSTAADQAKLAAYALKFATFRKVVATKKRTVKTPGKHTYTFDNTNALLGTYTGILGIKTGYTDKAGYCLMFAAKRGKRTQIGVLLGSATSAQRFKDAARLLDWGFGVQPKRYAFRSVTSRD